MFDKYPFLKAAREHVGSVTTSDVTDRIREHAENRILAAMGAEPDLPVDTRTEIMSYYVARIMLSIVNNHLLYYKWAGHEVSRFRINADEIPALCEHFGIERPIHFIDYIKFTEKISTIRVRLPSQTVVRGYVQLTDRNLIWLLKELVRLEYIKGLPAEDVKGRYDVSRIEKEAEKRRITDDYGQLVPDAFPPCVREFIRSIRAGRRVSHQARVFLVAFLSKIGMKKDDIINIFLTSPNADPEITGYQVDSILGRYDVTACLKLRSGGDCPKPDGCIPNAKHPLGVYKYIKELKEN